MISEGGLRKPEREAINIDKASFWNEGQLDEELRRREEEESAHFNF